MGGRKTKRIVEKNRKDNNQKIKRKSWWYWADRFENTKKEKSLNFVVETRPDRSEEVREMNVGGLGPATDRGVLVLFYFERTKLAAAVCFGLR